MSRVGQGLVGRIWAIEKSPRNDIHTKDEIARRFVRSARQWAPTRAGCAPASGLIAAEPADSAHRPSCG